MRKSLIALCILLLSVSAFAQVRTGNIYGKVVDGDGNALPGVSATLTGRYTAPQTVVTTAEGNFRYLSLPVSNDYAVRLELAGFQTKIEENIVINVGTNANLTLTMNVAALEEEITVTAVTPVVDSKKTSVSQNVTQDLLQGLPTARDPWVILQMAPSVVMDRENVGGAESGQQSTYVGRGATSYSNNVWSMDGVVITDPAAIGSSPSYYDFDAFEEMQITVGGSDVSVQTGGIAMNMVTRRGGNKMTFGGRFYYSDDAMQATYSPEKLAELGIAGFNKIRKSKDYGFNLGLPIVKDKAWFWGSYGVQDIGTFTVYGTKDDTTLENYVGKLNLQIIPQNRFEAFIHSGAKIKLGRSTSTSNPEGLAQGGAFKYGSPILKFQDEHMFGSDMFVSLKFAYGDSGFSLTPMTDLSFVKTPIWDVTAQRYYGSQASRYYVERPTYQYNFLTQYYNDNLFGASHEIKFGVEHAARKQYVESVWNGNFTISRNYNTSQIDLDANGTVDVPTNRWYYYSLSRGYYRNQFVDAYSGYLQDTLNFGRLTVMLGVRYDYQTPSIGAIKLAAITDSLAYSNPDFTMETATKSAIDALMPGVEVPDTTAIAEDGSTYAWKMFSPRLGLTYDVTGDGKTIAKLSFGQYGDFMGTGMADTWMRGGTSGNLRFWWNDANNDKTMTKDELYWLYRRTPGVLYQPYPVFDAGGNFAATADQIADANGYYWTNYDINNPTATTDPYTTYQADAGTSRTTEVLFTLEREIFTDFAVQMNATYRKYDRFNRSLKYFPGTTNIDNPNWYEVSPTRVPGTLPGLGSTGEASEHDFYYTTATGTAASNYYTVEKMPNSRYNDYWGVDIVLNKRLSNKWMFNGSATYQTQRAFYGERGEGHFNPTNLWAWEGQDSSAFIGGASGILDQYTNARWLIKMGGMYQLPYDINLSFNANIREGWIIRESFTYRNFNLPNPSSTSFQLDMNEFGSNRLPAVLTLNFKIEKMLRLGDNGRIYLMADVFNLINSDAVVRRQQKWHGTYTLNTDLSETWVPNVNDYRVDAVMNPRVARLGVRFTF
ncbi:MAG: carboxypeptidase regulatory-like domain-containing protein [Candidatus Aminicenantes bacterium]